MSSLLRSTKAAMRLQVRERLNRIALQQREVASNQICSKLRQEAIWKSADSILFFAPMPTEPDVWPLLQEALQARKAVCLPRFSVVNRTYQAARIQDLVHDLCCGQFGIREPTEACAEFPLSQFDLVLVPGVAFDSRGHRLGHGKGYYDRLLAGVSCLKCGIAFDEQIVEAVPVGPSDVHLDFILTPTQWLKAKRS